MALNEPTRTTLEFQGCQLELFSCGEGEPLLFLHPETGPEDHAPLLSALGAGRRVYAPSHPGFGASTLPQGFSDVDDLAYFYLDLVRELGLSRVAVLGASFGGWIAAEMAVRSTQRISHLVLAGAAGIKVADRERRDFVDLFALSQTELDALSFHDPQRAGRDWKALPEADLVALFRNREATGLFAWSPYMHHPKLRRRLHRIDCPALVLWGAQDRIVSTDYGRAYSAAIPGSAFELIDACGHYPSIEQPERLAHRVLEFLR
jgi:pimeloyl-ACP methyl ester carboxylesterase